ncbi:ATP-binding cassette domain-containing protein [Jatrophihabitans sp. YIM 134969]
MNGDGTIRVRGAREHNLRDVDVEFPRDRFVVVTGVSGSGKSSLAFGTVFAEAQRRYLESVAPYARRLIDQVGAPDVDEISGLPPAVALNQRRGTPSSRSSVGTVTTLSNSLRMLFSRTGDYPDGAPRLDSDAFSPNTTVGACPRCHGVGTVYEATEASMVPDPSLSIREGAIASWPGAWQGKNLRDILATLGHDVDRPWRELPQADRDWILFTDEHPVVTVHAEREAHRIQRPYQGTYTAAAPLVLRTFAESKSTAARRRAETFLHSETCPMCGGRRLNAAALAVTVAGHDIAEVAGTPLRSLADVLRPLARDAGDTAEAAVRRLLAGDLVARIDDLVRLGLGHLTTARTTPTLSAGELQRLRLATQLRSGLFGVVYVLDEPSAGLHPRDAEALTGVLDALREAGNSLLVVEHDLALVRRADHVIEIGPGAGTRGGRVLHSGTVADLLTVEGSPTAAALLAGPPTPAPRPATDVVIGLHDVSRHNLHHLDVEIPRTRLTVLTGVSGSGKSSLLAVLADHGEAARDRVVVVDQTPIGRTPRSNLATYTGLFDAVRHAFAATDDAVARGYDAGRFSFNVAGGRCETCEGDGFVAIELLFLPGTYAPCPTCHGARYNSETLEIRRDGLTIADVLALTVAEAVDRLADLPPAARALTALADVGLGYLRLGQPATELSGGEAQRIKLATELQRNRRGHTLYLFDEPTSGLHPADVTLLVRQLQALVEAGHTVVVAEHDLGVIAVADHVVDLGPGAGDDGGRVVVTGTPEQVAASGTGATAPFLRDHLSGSSNR